MIRGNSLQFLKKKFMIRLRSTGCLYSLSTFLQWGSEYWTSLVFSCKAWLDLAWYNTMG